MVEFVSWKDMKRYQIVLLAFISFVGIVWIVGRITNAIQYFTTPSHSNEPTLKSGSSHFASNLITPKRFDFICYEGANPNETDKKSTFVHRLCGLPGDTIEIREGDLYINNVNQDHSFN